MDNIKSIKKAIKYWKKFRKEIDKYKEDYKGTKHEKVMDDQIKPTELAITALEKEIPKPPHVHTENEFTDADGNRGMKVTYVECPNCGTEIDELNGLPRCIECGQIIDWNK